MNTKIILIVLAGIIVVGGGWWFVSMQNAPTPHTETVVPETADIGNTAPADTGVGDSGHTPPAPAASTEATVIYTDAGFSPETLTVKKGTSVIFLNKSSDDMWVASDDHPDHTGYDGTDKDEHCADGYAGPAPFDECSKDSSFTFVFTKTGTFGYHNHANHDMKGTVVVTD